MFAILQKYDFSSKSQLGNWPVRSFLRCLRYCKSTIFQANHNTPRPANAFEKVVCDTAKVRFFKQITTYRLRLSHRILLFAILQKYDFSSKSQLTFATNSATSGCLRYCKSTIFQANHNTCFSYLPKPRVVCDTAKVRFFKQITTDDNDCPQLRPLFAILQKYDFSSKSQQCVVRAANSIVVCDTAKVRFFKQITTSQTCLSWRYWLFAILQKYDFSSKSQQVKGNEFFSKSCLRYCKSTIFQANHNCYGSRAGECHVVCDTAKVRFFKQITTITSFKTLMETLFAILQKYDFSSKSQLRVVSMEKSSGCLRYCKSTIFQANHNGHNNLTQ